MSGSKIRSRSTLQALLALTLLVTVIAASATLPSTAAGGKYWAKYEFHGYNRDKSDYIIFYVYVDLSDPHFPDVNITGYKIVAGDYESDPTMLPGAKSGAELVMGNLIDFVADPENLPPDGVVKREVYNVTVYEVYDTNTYLLKYAKIGSEETTKYIYEIKLVDTNVEPGWLGGNQATSAAASTTQTAAQTTATQTQSRTLYFTYNLKFDLRDPKSGDTLRASGDVKITVSYDGNHAEDLGSEVLSTHIDSLPSSVTADEFRKFLEGFIGNYIPMWIPPDQLPSDGVYKSTSGNMLVSAIYDTNSGFLKQAVMLPSKESGVEGEGVIIELTDTNYEPLKGEAQAASPGGAGGGFGGILTAVIGAVIVAAIVTVFIMIKKKRGAKPSYGAYGPAYPPPPQTPPPPPG